MMKRAKGKVPLLAGSVLEAITGVSGVMIAVMYLFLYDWGQSADLPIGEQQSIGAMIGFCCVAVLHIAAAVIGFVCAGNPKRYLLPLIAGILLIVIANVSTNWQSAGVFTVALNILPGLLMIIGAICNARGITRRSGD